MRKIIVVAAVLVWTALPKICVFAEWVGGTDQLTYSEFMDFVQANKNRKDLNGRPWFSPADIRSLQELDRAFSGSQPNPIRESLISSVRTNSTPPEVPNDLVAHKDGKKEKVEDEDPVKKRLKAIASGLCHDGLADLCYDYFRHIFYNRNGITKQPELQQIYANYQVQLSQEMMGGNLPTWEVDPSIKWPVLATYTTDRRIRFATHTAQMSKKMQLFVGDHEAASGHDGDNGRDGSAIAQNSKGGAEEFAYGYMGCGITGGC